MQIDIPFIDYKIHLKFFYKFGYVLNRPSSLNIKLLIFMDHSIDSTKCTYQSEKGKKPDPHIH